MNAYNHEGRRDIVNGRDTSSKSSFKPRSAGYDSEREYRKNSHYYFSKSGKWTRGEKLYTMADFPGKSGDDLKWPEAQGNDEGARAWRDAIRKEGGNPNETIDEFIFRMNDPVIRRKRYLAMMLSKKASEEDDGVPVRYTPPRSSKKAAYYDEDL